MRECLLIQLNQFELDQTSPELKLAKNIVDQYLDVLAARDFKQLMRKLKVKEQDLQAAIFVRFMSIATPLRRCRASRVNLLNFLRY